MPSNELVTEASAKPQLTASVTTAKTTLGHTATITARDKAYQVCFKRYHQNISHNLHIKKIMYIIIRERGGKEGN